MLEFFEKDVALLCGDFGQETHNPGCIVQGDGQQGVGIITHSWGPTRLRELLDRHLFFLALVREPAYFKKKIQLINQIN